MIDPAIVEWCYAREIMRRLGFKPEELFFLVQTNGTVQITGHAPFHVPHGVAVVWLVVRANNLEFKMSVGIMEMGLAQIEAQHAKACELWNAGSPLFDWPGLHASDAWKERIQITKALQEKGFALPTLAFFADQL